jgi:3-oxoacyl-(acyl-carrier-protein) synthase
MPTVAGAAVLILEERERALHRGAKVLAQLVGCAANSDAFHTNAPPEADRGGPSRSVGSPTEAQFESQFDAN